MKVSRLKPSNLSKKNKFHVGHALTFSIYMMCKFISDENGSIYLICDVDPDKSSDCRASQAMTAKYIQ